MLLSEWHEFLRGLALQEKSLMTARISMLLKSRSSLTCFRASFLPGRSKDLSALRYLSETQTVIEIGCLVLRSSVMSRRAKFHNTGIVTEFLTLIKGAWLAQLI